ncbi:hypothetical protein HDV04_004862 [Boothiomyces sp. JEL0838]|nr:hypothetical protein HDV04_004862 [Boothiomyces sp. JEL0838]
MGDSNTMRQRNGTLSEANLVHTSSRSIPPVTYVLSEPQQPQPQQNTQPRESLSDIEEEVTERDGFITRLFKLRGFVSFIFLLVFGTAILISPTVNIVRTDPNAWIDFQQNTTALTSQTPNQIVVVWVAYEERMSQSRKAIDIIEHLRGALVGNMNLFGDLFESEKNDIKIPDPVSGEDEHVGKDDMPQDQEPPLRQRKSVFSWFSKNQQQPIPQDRNSIEIKVEEGDSLTRTLSLKNKVPTGSRTTKRKTLSKETKGNSFLTWDQFKSALKIGGLGAKKSKGMDLLSDRHAIFLSEKLFGVLRSPDTNEISVGSFFAYFDQEEQAKSAFALFDKDGNGSINQMELKWSVLRIYRERRNLMKSLRDLSSALGTLNDLLYGFSIILSLLLSLPVFGIPITAIVPFSTILVGLSFMFGGTAKVTFDSIIFIFAVHPYDVGDRVFIDGNNYVVEEFNILTTTFTIDGQKIYIPNAVLNGKTIINVRRSTDMSDYITIKVDFNTPESKLKELQAKMIQFTTAQSRNFRPTCSMDLMDMSSTGMITLRFSVDFKGNWQDGARRWGRRTAFLFELKRQLENHGIRFEMPVQPVRIIERE